MVVKLEHYREETFNYLGQHRQNAEFALITMKRESSVSVSDLLSSD